MGYTRSEMNILFVTMCIPTRLLLSYMVYSCHVPSTLVMIVAVFAIIRNFMNVDKRNKQGEERSGIWWPIEFHIAMSTLMFLTANAGHMRLTGQIMAIDTIIGAMSYAIQFV